LIRYLACEIERAKVGRNIEHCGKRFRRCGRQMREPARARMPSAVCKLGRVDARLGRAAPIEQRDELHVFHAAGERVPITGIEKLPGHLIERARGPSKGTDRFDQPDARLLLGLRSR
jgi:hypothetical protein